MYSILTMNHTNTINSLAQNVCFCSLFHASNDFIRILRSVNREMLELILCLFGACFRVFLAFLIAVFGLCTSESRILADFLNFFTIALVFLIFLMRAHARKAVQHDLILAFWHLWRRIFSWFQLLLSHFHDILPHFHLIRTFKPNLTLRLLFLELIQHKHNLKPTSKPNLTKPSRTLPNQT